MSTQDRARQLLEKRMTAIAELEDANAALEDAKKALTAAAKKQGDAWSGARASGWTERELTKDLGFSRPANRSGGRPKGAGRKGTAAVGRPASPEPTPVDPMRSDTVAPSA
ncbi:hypothetical protein [Luteipulveratus halotolerans]|uniref:hypothetical protein n=1 Tax=Luteipulveratus halotolerans TaxID=1631356 RepID=UPI0012F8FBE1|nr:hypothetical protein [Luteipulveratus halotolerans]